MTVLVPAYNAQATIEATLLSVQAQRFQEWECIVVDDGSTDATADIVQRFVAADDRFRLFRQANKGVASARNLALREGRGMFAAPIDADDLWHPDYLVRQHEAMTRGPTEPSFVYCRSRWIDANGAVVASQPPRIVEGKAVLSLLYENIVGTSSAVLFRRCEALELGGYDERLRGMGAEGAEDVLLQLRFAARRGIAIVPEYLVGYRTGGFRMSADGERMFRSAAAAIDLFLAERQWSDPRLRIILRRRRGAQAFQLAWTRARAFSLVDAARLLGRGLRLDPVRGLLIGARFALRPLHLPLPGRPRRPFLELSPMEIEPRGILSLRRRVDRLDSARHAALAEDDGRP